MVVRLESAIENGDFVSVVDSFELLIPGIRETCFHVCIKLLIRLEDHSRASVVLEELPVPYARCIVRIYGDRCRLDIANSLIYEGECLERVEVVECEDLFGFEAEIRSFHSVLINRDPRPLVVVLERYEIRSEYVEASYLSAYRILPDEARPVELQECRNALYEVVLDEREVFVVELLLVFRIHEVEIEACGL